MLEQNADMKNYYDMEQKAKLLGEKNKMLFSEVVTLRKEVDKKDFDLEKSMNKVTHLEKKLIMVQKQSQ